MKQIILLTTIIISILGSASAQKLTEPLYLGNFIAGEDPSEFLLHTVMEQSQSLLEENPEGKLIVRICSSDEFTTAFIKAPLNPLSASQYNQYRLLVPYERIFIARSSKCLGKGRYIFNEYLFVPGESKFEYEEIFPVNDINYKIFVIDEFDYSDERVKSINEQNKEFEKRIEDFVNELKNNSVTEGFIVHNSKNKRMKNNIEKVYAILQKENISLQRVKTINKIRLDGDRNFRLKPVKEKYRFPRLAVITVIK
jgi:hypothetical protein